MEGDTSQVEMIQSSDMNEEVGENGDEGHLSHKSNRQPHVAQNFECTTKSLCFMAATIVFTFVFGKRGRKAYLAHFCLSEEILTPRKLHFFLNIFHVCVKTYKV